MVSAVAALMLTGCELMRESEKPHIQCRIECEDCKSVKHDCEFERTQEKMGTKR